MKDVVEVQRDICYLNIHYVKLKVSNDQVLSFTIRAYDDEKTGLEYVVELTALILWTRYGFYSFDKERVRGEGYSEYTFSTFVNVPINVLDPISIYIEGEAQSLDQKITFSFDDNYPGGYFN